MPFLNRCQQLYLPQFLTPGAGRPV